MLFRYFGEEDRCNPAWDSMVLMDEEPDQKSLSAWGTIIWYNYRQINDNLSLDLSKQALFDRRTLSKVTEGDINYITGSILNTVRKIISLNVIVLKDLKNSIDVKYVEGSRHQKEAESMGRACHKVIAFLDRLLLITKAFEENG